MSEDYVNMRLKVPQFIHAQLVKKQAEMKRLANSDHFTLEDTALAVMTETFLWEYQRKTDEKEELRRTNCQEDVLN